VTVLVCRCSPFCAIDRPALSSANPWLDFLPPAHAPSLARDLNEDLEEYCSTSPALTGSTLRRLYGFGLLPLVPEATTTDLLDTVDQVAKLPHLKGIIMGTRGIGKGLDDVALEPVWAAIEKSGLVIFLHPHYGVGGDQWGERPNGHVLPLALGFPFETTIVSSLLSSSHTRGYRSFYRRRPVSYFLAHLIDILNFVSYLLILVVLCHSCRPDLLHALTMIPWWLHG
jgi:hypothetical protein